MFSRQRDTDRPRHRLAKVLLVLGSFVALLWSAAYFLSPQDKLQPSDAIVVISGGQTLTRAKRGIELYKSGYAPKLIFSGAALDDGPSNAKSMRAEAERLSVPREAIEIDEAAETTYQNATNVKLILDKTQSKKFILVTSPYHQRRAYLTFRKVFGKDYQIINQSSYDNRWSKAAWWLSPFGVYITGSELVKVGYLYLTGQYQ